MRIVLDIDELLLDIRNKSHEECATAIADTEARYRAEAGNHKNLELFRCIAEVGSALSRSLHRYLVDYFQDEADNNDTLPQSLVYELNLSERRASGKAQPLADAMHQYVVHYALAKFYATVSQTELSNKHSTLTQDASQTIDALLLTKKPPLV